VGKRSPRRAPAAVEKPSALRRLLGRTSVQAVSIGLLLFLVYLANGDFLPGNDATANVRLAAKMVSQRKLVFTPEEDPFLFAWRVNTPQGVQFARFRSWEQPLNGEPVRLAYQRGEVSKPVPDYFLVKTRFPGVYANRYGLGAALFAAPFVAAIYPLAGDLYQRSAVGMLWHACKVATAFAVAASAVFIFLAALAFVRPSTAAGLALIYGLGTCVWSTSSQTLWQHGPAGFFLALGALLMLRRGRPSLAYGLGLCLAMAFICRPTAAVIAIVIAGYYLKTDRRGFLRLTLGALPVVLLFAVYNLYTFGRPVALGQLGETPHALLAIPKMAMAGDKPMTQLFGRHVLEGVAGSLFSPSRGLLVFSPIVAFAFWGLGRAWRDPEYAILRPLGAAALANILVAAAWYGWWGGWCYGYRLLVDSVPLLALVAIPIAESIRQQRWLRTTFAVCALWSILVQVVGAFAYDVVSWNNRKVFVIKTGGQTKIFLDRDEAQREFWASGGQSGIGEVDVNGHAERLWSLRDSEILYYLEHFSESRRLRQLAVKQFLHDKG
jgi:hypothetical protein